MERRQARMLVVLAVALLAVTALLYLAPEKQGDPSDPDATAVVWDLDPDALVRIELAGPDGTVVLAREAGATRWSVGGADGPRADPDRVHDLLEALRELERGIPIEGEDPAAFGLDAPVVQVTATSADGSTAEVVVGGRSPVGYRTYARTAAGDVVAVNGHPGTTLAQDEASFRDRRVLHFEPADVRGIRVEGPDGVLAVSGEGLDWWLEGFTRADPDRVDDLALGLLDIRFDRLEALEVDAPRTVLTVHTEGHDPRVIRVGDVVDGSAAVVGDEASGWVRAPTLALLGQGPTDLGDRQALPLDVERDDRVVVTLGGARWETTRNGSAWMLAGQESFEAREAVLALGRAEIVYQREPVPELGEIWATVEVVRGDRSATIDLGQVVEPHRIARDRRGGSTYLVPVSQLAVVTSLPPS